MSSPKAIVANTAAAMRGLEEQLQAMRTDDSRARETNALVPGEVWSVRINSGSFHVPWEETKRVLEEGEMDVVVVRPPAGVGGKQRTGRGEKRHSAAELKSTGKRSRSEKAAKSVEMTEASKAHPRRSKALGEAAEAEENDAAGVADEAEPLRLPRRKYET